MSWSKLVDVLVECDAPDGPGGAYVCTNMYTTGLVSQGDQAAGIAGARKEARLFGWRHTKGIDLCPRHAKVK